MAQKRIPFHFRKGENFMQTEMTMNECHGCRISVKKQPLTDVKEMGRENNDAFLLQNAKK